MLNKNKNYFQYFLKICWQFFQIIEGRAGVLYTNYDDAIAKVVNQASVEFENDPTVQAYADSELKRYELA